MDLGYVARDCLGECPKQIEMLASLVKQLTSFEDKLEEGMNILF